MPRPPTKGKITPPLATRKAATDTRCIVAMSVSIPATNIGLREEAAGCPAASPCPGAIALCGERVWLRVGSVSQCAHFRDVEPTKLHFFRHAHAEDLVVELEEAPGDTKGPDEGDQRPNDLGSELADIAIKQTLRGEAVVVRGAI